MKTNIIGTTTAEAEALAATAAALAAGNDPFGDDGDDETTTAAGEDGAVDEESAVVDEVIEPGTDGETKPKTEGEGEALSAEALAAIAADEEVIEPVTAAPRYKAGDLDEIKAKRAEQNTIKAKALKDLMDGVIEPEAYSAIEAEVTEALEALAVQRTLHEANVQTEQQTQESVIDKIIASAKKAGEVDYRADPKAAKQFDTALAMLADDGETRTYAELAAEAHRAVLAIRGIKKPEPTAEEAAAAAAALAAKPRENGKGPVTLRNLPAAEIANSGGGWKEQLATLSGQAYEEAFSKLSPGQKAELMND